MTVSHTHTETWVPGIEEQLRLALGKEKEDQWPCVTPPSVVINKVWGSWPWAEWDKPKTAPRPDTKSLPPFIKQPSSKECISFCLAYAMACLDPEWKYKTKELAMECFNNTPAMSGEWYRSIEGSIKQMKERLQQENIYIEGYTIVGQKQRNDMTIRSDQYKKRDKWVFYILYMEQGKHVVMAMPDTNWGMIYYDSHSGDKTEVYTSTKWPYKLNELEQNRGKITEIYTITIWAR